jgi:hypothetical protein
VPETTRSLGAYTVKDWTDSAESSALSFALHRGGRGVSKGWADMVLDWFGAQPWPYQRRTLAPISVVARVTPAMARPYQVT